MVTGASTGRSGWCRPRAPSSIAGKGVRDDGTSRDPVVWSTSPPPRPTPRVARTDDHGHHLAGQDGVVRDDVLDPAAGRPRHVVGFLFDGVNPNVLYAMAAAGEAPNVARLVEMGTAYEWGAMAGLPTVTWPTTRRSSPGASGSPRHPAQRVVPPGDGEQVITNWQATWPWAMKHVTAEVESLHRRSTGAPQHLHRVGRRTVRPRRRLLDVPLLPAGEVPPIRVTEGLPDTTERFVRPSNTTRGRRWSTTWARSRPSASGAGGTATLSFPKPMSMWCNFTLTDSTFPEGGPFSEIARASVRDPTHGRRRARRGRARACVRRHRVRARRRRRHAGDGVPTCAATGHLPLHRRGHRLPRRGVQVVYVGEAG